MAAAVLLLVGAALSGCRGPSPGPATPTEQNPADVGPPRRVDYFQLPIAFVNLGAGLLVSASDDGAAVIVRDTDDPDPLASCGGEPYPSLTRVEVDSRTRAPFGLAGARVSGDVVRDTAGHTAVVKRCDGRLSELRVGAETASGRVDRLAPVELIETDRSLNPLAWSSDGRTLLAVRPDTAAQAGAVVAVDPASGQVDERFLFHTDGVRQLAQLRDGAYVLATGAGVTLRSPTGEVVRTVAGATGFVLAPDGGSAVAFGTTIEVLRADRIPEVVLAARPGRTISAMAISPDGATAVFLAGADDAHEAFLLGMRTGRTQLLTSATGCALAPLYSHDGRMLSYDVQSGGLPRAVVFGIRWGPG